MKASWCHLRDLADVELGYKSLQNEFFYLSRDTIEQFGIENEYLQDIFKFRDLDNQEFFQKPSQTTWLFYCRKNETDLRGTGALKYIRAMAKRPAAVKRQGGDKHATIQDALEEQGGKRWYAPKASPKGAQIWLRKAFAGIFAPFLFESAVTVDQRCNRILPKDDITWKELAAAMTTSLFPLALEADGACSMGGGALEWKTKSLRTAKVIDLRRFEDRQRSELVALAEDVWKTTTPVDFNKNLVNKPLEELDNYVLALLGNPVSREMLYADLHATVKGRIEKAKVRKARSQVQDNANVEEVASAIAQVIQPFLDAHRFPEDFYPSNSASQSLELPENAELTITAEQFMSHGHLRVEDVNGNIVLEIGNSAMYIELITRALLIGRRRFSVPVEENVVSTTLSEIFPWLRTLKKEISEAVNTSALGSRFEDQLIEAILQELRISPAAFEPEMWASSSITLTV